jgi:hypothetical protein
MPFGCQKRRLLKAMLHGAISLATCNAILLLRDVKLPNTSLYLFNFAIIMHSWQGHHNSMVPITLSLHYTLLMFSQHIENSSLISLINISQE